MDVVFEILFEIYTELMLLVVPEEKKTKKKYKVLAVFIALIGITLTAVSFIYGAYLIVDKNDPVGLIPICMGILLSLAQIVAGIKIRFGKK